MRIGLFGLFGCGNSGNDASLEAMLIFLRRLRPDYDITCICPQPDTVARSHSVAAIGSSPASFNSGAARRVDALYGTFRAASWASGMPSGQLANLTS